MISADFILGMVFGTLFGMASICIIVYKERNSKNDKTEKK